MDIGQKLKDTRAKAGLTQEQVAEIIGVSRQTVSSWENNRSYPDIASILKLSDLYSLSLDELLKEDANMRKHVEESAQTLKTLWNVLCELSLLLIPVAIFMQHYDWDTTAAVLYAISAVLFTVPRLLVPKLFGGSWKLELLHIVFYLLLLADLLWFYHSRTATVRILLLDSLLLAVLTRLEHKNSFLPRSHWSIMALVLLVPLFMFVADSDDPAKQSELNPYAPFPGSYQVAEVIYTSDPDAEKPIVTLQKNTRFHRPDPLTSWKETYGILYLKEPGAQEAKYIGEMTELEVPAGEPAPKGIWQAVPENDPSLLYQITVEADESITISCYQADSLQWKYRLEPLESLKVGYSATANLLNSGERGNFQAQWFLEGSLYAPEDLYKIESLGKISVSLMPNYPADSLTVYEDYYHDGELSTTEMTIQPDENGIFRLEPEAYHDSGSRCSIYRVPYENGEFVFRINFP